MAVAITTEDRIPKREAWYSSMAYHQQQVNLHVMEAGKAIIAAGSKWPRTQRNRSPVIVTEIPQFDQNIYRLMYIRIGLLHEAVNLMSETLIESGMVFGAPRHLLQDEEFELEKIPNLKKNLVAVRRWARYIALASRFIELLKPALWSGNGYAEVVFDSESKWKLTHFKVLDPREMRVVRGKTGEILGYVQFPFNSPLGVLTSARAKSLVTDQGAVFFEKDEIIHLKWNPLPGEAYGLSIFEPVKDDSANTIGIRDDMGMIVKNNAAPTTHYQLGTETIPAAKKAITKFASDIEQMDWTVDLVTSTLVESKPLKDPSKIMDVPHYLRAQLNLLYASLGLPEILFGQGNETTEATAKVQIEAAAKKFRAIQRMLRDQVELFIFSRLLESIDHENLMPEDMDIIPEIYFQPIETAEDKRLRLENGVKNGSLTHQDYRREYGYELKRKGDLILEQDKEYQLELAKTSPPQQSIGGGSTPSGPSKQRKKDRSAASSAKKGNVK